MSLFIILVRNLWVFCDTQMTCIREKDSILINKVATLNGFDIYLRYQKEGKLRHEQSKNVIVICSGVYEEDAIILSFHHALMANDIPP